MGGSSVSSNLLGLLMWSYGKTPFFVTADDTTWQERIDKLKKAHVECQVDPATKVDEDLIEKFYKDEPVDETKLAKHALCINMKVGIQKPNGDIDKEGFKKWMSGIDNGDQIIEECGNKTGSTAEETTLALYKCFRKHKHEHGLHHHHD
ncbi:unnamed protein product [Phaedon cochleariae]|uniref:Uncharacterized protein n=1 Tax=Phaedon cochleariae TaxID=80249 RepID=A0A9N9SMK9_PHACE|nr:unnamed protein product [Phaedon cochleariae]